jgi:hypothetical protein
MRLSTGYVVNLMNLDFLMGTDSGGEEAMPKFSDRRLDEQVGGEGIKLPFEDQPPPALAIFSGARGLKG